MTDEMNDEQLQEMIRSSSNAEDVQDYLSRTGLELSSSELRAVTAVVDFRAAGVPKEASASRRAAFLGRVALHRTREPEAGRPWNPWIRRMALAAVAIAALGVAALGGANAEGIGESLGLREQKNVYTTTSFQPRFSITFPEVDREVDPYNQLRLAWGVNVDKRDAFIAGNARQGIGIYRPVGWADPAGDALYIRPSDIPGWLRRNPRLDVGPPTTVTVGGIKATQVDVQVLCPACAEIRREYEAALSRIPSSRITPNELLPSSEALKLNRQLQEALANESVTLFHLVDPFLGAFGTQPVLVPRTQTWLLDFTVGPEGRFRLITFDSPYPPGPGANDGLITFDFPQSPPPGFNQREDIVVIASVADPIEGGAAEFEEIVQPMLDSITFKEPRRR